MEQAPGTAHREGETERISVTAWFPLPRNGSWRQTRVQLFDLFHQAAHLVDGVIAALRSAGVARTAAQMHFDFHAPALPAINAQTGGLGDEHAIRADAVFLGMYTHDRPSQSSFLHRADTPERVVARGGRDP